jgi:hypothetical protein
VFAANALVGVVALVIVLRLVPRSRSATPRRIDVPGQLLVAGFLATLTYALIEAPRYGFGSARIATLLVVAVALVAAFVAIELRVAEPLLDLRFFRDRQFAGAIAISGMMFFAFAGFIFFNALYLQDVRGYSALAAGFLTLPAAVPAVVGGPLAGTLGLALGLGGLVLLPAGTGLGALIACYLLLGSGYAIHSAPVSTVAVASMPRDQAGVAAGVASSSRNVGIVLGIAVLGTIVNGRVAQVVLPGTGVSASSVAAFRADYVDALHVAYAVAALVAVAAAAIAALTMRPVLPGKESPA